MFVHVCPETPSMNNPQIWILHSIRQVLVHVNGLLSTELGGHGIEYKSHVVLTSWQNQASCEFECKCLKGLLLGVSRCSCSPSPIPTLTRGFMPFCTIGREFSIRGICVVSSCLRPAAGLLRVTTVMFALQFKKKRDFKKVMWRRCSYYSGWTRGSIARWFLLYKSSLTICSIWRCHIGLRCHCTSGQFASK